VKACATLSSFGSLAKARAFHLLWGNSFGFCQPVAQARAIAFHFSFHVFLQTVTESIKSTTSGLPSAFDPDPVRSGTFRPGYVTHIIFLKYI
jgi:hypothetical protein